MEPAELELFKVGYGDEQIVFYPRMTWVSEVDDAAQRFYDIPEGSEQKHQKEFDVLIDVLSEWSAQAPEKLVKEKGEMKRVPLVENAESPLDAMKRYFSDRTPKNERILRAAYNTYLSQMTRTVTVL